MFLDESKNSHRDVRLARQRYEKYMAIINRPLKPTRQVGKKTSDLRRHSQFGIELKQNEELNYTKFRAKVQKFVQFSDGPVERAMHMLL